MRQTEGEVFDERRIRCCGLMMSTHTLLPLHDLLVSLPPSLPPSPSQQKQGLMNTFDCESNSTLNLGPLICVNPTPLATPVTRSNGDTLTP